MIILFMIQIILESLPLSSSGHLALIYHVTGEKNLSSSLMWLAHAPTVILIIGYFHRTALLLLRYPWRTRAIWYKLCMWGMIAECMTVLFYCTLRSVTFPLWIGFCITATLLASTLWCTSSIVLPRWWHYIVIGCVQGAAVLPGISRLAVTYSVGRLCGLAPLKSFNIAWMFALPLYGAASLVGVTLINVPLASIMPFSVFLLTLALSGMLFYGARSMMLHGYQGIFAFYLIGVALYCFICGL